MLFKKLLLSFALVTTLVATPAIQAQPVHITYEVLPWDNADITAIQNAIKALQIEHASIKIGRVKDAGYGIQRLQVSVVTDSSVENDVLKAISKAHPDIERVEIASHLTGLPLNWNK